MAAQIKRLSAPSPSRPLPEKKPLRKAKLLSSKVAYKGKVFSVFSDKVEEPGGFINTRDVIRHNGSVVVLAVDESKNKKDPDIILERQYRHAAGQFLLELPAGRVEPGETTLAAAKREMIEETGYRAKRWTLLTKLLCQPRLSGRVDADLSRSRYSRRRLRPGARRANRGLSDAAIRGARFGRGQQDYDGKTLIGLLLYDAGRRAGRL